MSERMEEFERRLAQIERRLAHAGSGPVAGTAPASPAAPGSHVAPASPSSDYVLHREADEMPFNETPLIRHNQIGEPYSIKLVYPGFYLTMNTGDTTCAVGFPAIKEKLAKRIQPGHLFFIYVTSPERRIIGMAQASAPAEFEPERDIKRPWSLPLAWVIGPKWPGVRFEDMGLQVRARIGDSTYAIGEETAAAIIERMQDMPDLNEAELEKLKERFRMFA